jgi:hypothetical protein
MLKATTSAAAAAVVRRVGLTTRITTVTSGPGCRAMSSSSSSTVDKWGAMATPFDVIKAQKALHLDIIPKSDHGEFLEYSVIHTDRSLNLMSSPFQQVMRELNVLLKTTYSADKVAIMPG